MRIGIFGGTFNPPHMGHIDACRFASANLKLDRLYLVPTKVPPHKQLPEGSASPEQRFEMTALAAAMIPGAQAWDVELKREGPSYSADTVMDLRRMYPDDELILIVGSDMFFTLDKWRRAEELLSSVTVCVMSRNAEDFERLSIKAAELKDGFGARSVILDKPILEVSSSDLRGGSKLADIPMCIWDYIVKNGLYGDLGKDMLPSYMEMLRNIASASLSGKRAAHVMGCERLACRLAERWGGDKELCRAAAILHDITKEKTVEEQLQICEKYGIIPDYDRYTEKALFHSLTGWLVALREIGVPENIALAIKHHTLGRPNMSLEEKILFVADKVEETRKYPGTEEIRALAFENLDAAAAECIKRTVDDIKRRGNKVNPAIYDTLAALTASDKSPKGRMDG